MFHQYNASRITLVITLAALTGIAGLGCGGSRDSAPTAPKEIPAAMADSPETAQDAATVPSAEVESPQDEVDPAAKQREEAHQAYERWDAAFAKGNETAQSEWAAIAGNIKAQSLVDGLDYVAMHTRVSPTGTYTLWLLFQTTKDISEDYHLAIDGYVSPDHVSQLPESAQSKGILKIHRRLHDNPTSNWKKGEYHAVDMEIDGPVVPYNLLLLGFSPTEDVFWNHVGNRLSLGWTWAAADEKELIARIGRCETPAALYTLAPSGPRLPVAVAEALDGKWSSLTAGMTPKELSPGLDFLSLDTKVAGDRGYLFSVLVKSTRDLDNKYIFTVLGSVDPSHLQHITPVEEGATYASWHIDPKHDPMNVWKANTYHVATLQVDTELIPYNISLWVSPRGDDGNWDWMRKGNRIDLGWQAASPVKSD